MKAIQVFSCGFPPHLEKKKTLKHTVYIKIMVGDSPVHLSDLVHPSSLLAKLQHTGPIPTFYNSCSLTQKALPDCQQKEFSSPIMQKSSQIPTFRQTFHYPLPQITFHLQVSFPSFPISHYPILFLWMHHSLKLIWLDV